jgi:hypothetical protein
MDNWTWGFEKYLRLDADDPPGGGGDPPQTDTDSGGDGGEDGDGQEAPATVTMTQEELDALMGERAKRARKATSSALLDKLGVKDEKELAALVKAQRDAAEAQKSDLDKAKEQIEALEAQNKALAEQLERQTKEAAVRDTARSMQFRDPEDALAHVSLDELEVGEDRKVTGVKEALEALSKAKPYLIEKEQESPPDINARAAPEKDQNAAAAKEAAVRQRFGM